MTTGSPPRGGPLSAALPVSVPVHNPASPAAPVGIGAVLGDQTGVVVGVNDACGLSHVFFADGREGTYPSQRIAAALSPRRLRAGQHSGADDPAGVVSFIQQAKYSAALREDYVTAQRCQEELEKFRHDIVAAEPLADLCDPLPSSVFERQLVTAREARADLCPELAAPPAQLACAAHIFAEFVRIHDACRRECPATPEQAGALAVLRMYRRLCRVAPQDTALSGVLAARARAGAALLDACGSLSKTPARPEGWAADAYNLALQGANGSLAVRGTGNRGGGGKSLTLSQAVHCMMNDSGLASGRTGVAHRRWLLAPGLAETGFGSAGRTHLVYTYAASQSHFLSPPYVAFPPSACFPVEWFDEDMLWSCQLNPTRYAVSDEGVSVTVTPVASDSTNLTRLEPLALRSVGVDVEQHGMGPCVTFRPEGLYLADGTCYEVQIHGLLELPQSTGELEVNESVAADGTTVITAYNNTANLKYVLKYTFEGRDGAPAQVVAGSECVLQLPNTLQFRMSLDPGESAVFVRGVWQSYRKVHASGPPDAVPAEARSAKITYLTAFFSTGLPSTEVDSRNLR